MQFVMLIYQGTTPVPTAKEAWASLSEADRKAIYADYDAVNKTAGVTPGPPLGLPESAMTVQVRNGETRTSAGPFVDLLGAVGGFLVFDKVGEDCAGSAFGCEWGAVCVDEDRGKRCRKTCEGDDDCPDGQDCRRLIVIGGGGDTMACY